MSKVLIKSARIVTAVDDYAGDILIEDGRVEAIGRSLEVDDAAVHDASGLLAIPGGVDVHVHMETPMGNGIETCDSFETGTRSAAFGCPLAAASSGNPPARVTAASVTQQA